MARLFARSAVCEVEDDSMRSHNVLPKRKAETDLLHSPRPGPDPEGCSQVESMLTKH